MQVLTVVCNTVCKILGAAAEEGFSFKDTLNLGKEVVDALVSCVVALDHTHVRWNLRGDLCAVLG